MKQGYLLLPSLHEEKYTKKHVHIVGDKKYWQHNKNKHNVSLPKWDFFIY